jgi:TetR/AcrR family transcriptional regulator, lmrAB and yxaGH operons repressor
MASDSKDRMVQSAAALISTRGVNATSFSDVLADSGAPRGSIYHHFPDGKSQLAQEAVRWAGERVLVHLRAGTESTPAGVLGRFIDMWRQVVLRSGGTAGCVVAGTVVDSPAVGSAVVGGLEADSTGEGASDDGLIDVARATFRSWAALLTDQLIATGVPAPRAGAISLATLAGMEGALILCRTESSVEPLDAVAAELLRLLPSEA